MKKTGFFVFAAVLVWGVSSWAAGLVQWMPLKEGMARAKQENKPLIVDFFYGKGCARCEDLEKKVYGNAAIAKKINDDFVPVLINLAGKLSPEEEALGKKYDYKNDCLLTFLDPSGNVVSDPAGKRMCFVEGVDPDQYIRYLDYVRKTLQKDGQQKQ